MAVILLRDIQAPTEMAIVIFGLSRLMPPGMKCGTKPLEVY